MSCSKKLLKESKLALECPERVFVDFSPGVARLFVLPFLAPNSATNQNSELPNRQETKVIAQCGVSTDVCHLRADCKGGSSPRQSAELAAL